jgi:hypothetical protein
MRDRSWLVLAIAVALVIGTLAWGMPAYSRYQDRANAENQVTLNDIQIRQTQQLVEVEKQKAAMRVADAQGIAEAQKIINATLSDRYLQHEAIQAQVTMAQSSNHTTVYIPSGNMGIPLVKTVPD